LEGRLLERTKMGLKIYQQKAIEQLKEYLELVKTKGPNDAFYNLKKEIYHETFNEVPFVCIKIPTGGGKTLVGCHSVIEIMSNFLQEKRDKGIVVWFTPNDAIKSQTLKKFKDPTDIHRKELNEYFGKDVKIFSNEEALSIKKHEVEDNLCIIIASLDAFRKEELKKPKYKVYQDNGALLEHFQNLENEEGLRKNEGAVIYSLENVIRLARPLVIVDEGHRTKTSISETTIKELNPEFILEFTATPKEGSNILVDTSPSDLKEENMIKIPIVLESHKDWSAVIDKGIEEREHLEDIAKKNKEKIRPIALIQAEPDRKDEKDITVEKVKEYLINKKINPEEIAIKTSKQNDIEGIDLQSKNCKIRYIITIAALAEGWDCSYAYVLISVSNIGSKIAVEQIIGRVIRMPFAEKRKHNDLNMCYVFASAPNFSDAADKIIKGLKENGYTGKEYVKLIDKDQEKEEFAEKKFEENISIPIFSFDNKELSFREDLIGENFPLSKQDYKIDFDFLDKDAKGIIDLDENRKWIPKRIRQAKLTQYFKNKKSISEEDLIMMIDEKLRFPMISKNERSKYIRNVIDCLIKIDKKTLYELYLYMPLLLDEIKKKIKAILEDHAKKTFNKYIKEGKISISTFDSFPDKIQIGDRIERDYNKSYYDKLEKLNKEEKSFVDDLDLEGENIRFWIRCREKKDDSFALQGWEDRKFYPDFVAITNKSNVLAFEWKGEHLEDNKDSEYKKELGKVWERLDKKLHFFFVTNKNKTDVLKKIKEL